MAKDEKRHEAFSVHCSRCGPRASVDSSRSASSTAIPSPSADMRGGYERQDGLRHRHPTITSTPTCSCCVRRQARATQGAQGSPGHVRKKNGITVYTCHTLSCPLVVVMLVRCRDRFESMGRVMLSRSVSTVTSSDIPVNLFPNVPGIWCLIPFALLGGSCCESSILCTTSATTTTTTRTIASSTITTADAMLLLQILLLLLLPLPLRLPGTCCAVLHVWTLIFQSSGPEAP